MTAVSSVTAVLVGGPRDGLVFAVPADEHGVPPATWGYDVPVVVHRHGETFCGTRRVVCAREARVASSGPSWRYRWPREGEPGPGG